MSEWDEIDDRMETALTYMDAFEAWGFNCDVTIDICKRLTVEVRSRHESVTPGQSVSHVVHAQGSRRGGNRRL